jgi:Tfp pilus assembly PilM family ATPase
MAASSFVRTGIDLGSAAVKLMRAEGGAVIRRLTHAGLETWDPEAAGNEVARAAGALQRLLRSLGLTRRMLGRIAVAAVDDDSAIREVVVPMMPEEDLRRALPFEAKRHLYYDGMDSPALDAQVLGTANAVEEEGGPAMRALLVAVPGKHRDFALSALAAADLEPEVIDLEPLATLNAATWLERESGPTAGPVAVLDLGRMRTRLTITHADGGLLTRTIGPGVPPADDADAEIGFAATVAAGVRETVLFYRGRYRRDITRVGLAGGGALRSASLQVVQETAGVELTTLDPLRDPAAASLPEELAGQGPRFVTAYGLCRWWDEFNV